MTAVWLIVVAVAVSATADLILPVGDPWLVGILVVCFTIVVVAAACEFVRAQRQGRRWPA